MFSDNLIPTSKSSDLDNNNFEFCTNADRENTHLIPPAVYLQQAEHKSLCFHFNINIPQWAIQTGPSNQRAIQLDKHPIRAFQLISHPIGAIQ